MFLNIANDTKCSIMAAGQDVAAFGVDATFKPGSDLYNPDLDTEMEKASFYNCSLLSNATYAAANTGSAEVSLLACKCSCICIAIPHIAAALYASGRASL